MIKPSAARQLHIAAIENATSLEEKGFLDKAETYVVSDEMAELVSVSAETMPYEMWVPEDAPSKSGLMFFPTRFDQAAFAWEIQGETLYLFRYSVVGGRLAATWGAKIHTSDWEVESYNPYSTSKEQAGGAVLWGSLIVRTSWIIMRQRLAFTEHVRARKTSFSGGKTRLNTEMRVIHLRAKEKAPSRGEELEVDWSCRWIVKGHWRKQWYPSENRHRAILVPSYIKGPEDKPLKPKSPIVYAVDR